MQHDHLGDTGTGAKRMHAFLLALLVTGVAAFGSLPAAHPGNPCLDPNDFLATNSIVRPPYCAVPNAISETKDTCEAAGCYWDEYPDPGSDSCGCGSQQLCESDAVGGTWTVNSFTCGDEGLLNQGWNCASNPGELGWFSGGCCSGGAAASKCNAVCEIADCAFNPCKDPNDFDPAASKPDDHCEDDEPPNPIAASREACVAVGCEWNEGNPNDPCHCNSQQLCESPAVGGTWTARSLTCGGSQVQGGGPSWACDAEDAWLIDHFAGVCCRGGTASSKCNCEALDCAFNPCMDPNDFDPMAAVPYAVCDGDSENGNPIAASQEACEAASCEWQSSSDEPCHCGSEQLCESPAVGGTWNTGSHLCGSGYTQGIGSTLSCASDEGKGFMAHYATMCCRGGAASSKCA